MMPEKLNKNRFVTRALLLISAIAVLPGCSKDLSDLEQYRSEVLARKSGRIEPLPQIKPYENFNYDDRGRRSPFDPEEASSNTVSANNGGLRPDPNRKREFLEDFPLDSLRMVGTLNMRGELIGLVQDPEGLIHQVRTGEFAGQNHGRIVALNDSEIKIVEIISDGLGGWIERPAAIALSD
ncbi:MAG: pilus assembly protein PilP [Gammaproteobacteria bacterium]|nr:pilus assembly protein PilP [Gammaproteobacteria bacterium]